MFPSDRWFWFTSHCIIINMMQWPVFLPSSLEGKLHHLYNGNPLLLFCNHKIGVGRSGIFWVLFFAPFLIIPVTLTWDYPLGFLPYKNGRDACCQLPSTPLQDTRTPFCGYESNSFLQSYLKTSWVTTLKFVIIFGICGSHFSWRQPK